MYNVCVSVSVNNPEPIKNNITVNGQPLERVEKFKYLGATISEEGSKPEVLARAAQALIALAKLRPIWKTKNISLKTKVRLLRALVMSIFLYACESWTLTAKLQRRIESLEMKCYRRLLGISYRDHVTNESIRRTITQHIGQHDDLLTVVKKRKLQWYGHVTRSNGLSKTILQGTVEGGRRRGRQRKKWSDNVKEWTGMSFADSQAACHNRQNWAEVVKSSAVQRSDDSADV